MDANTGESLEVGTAGSTPAINELDNAGVVEPKAEETTGEPKGAEPTAAEKRIKQLNARAKAAAEEAAYWRGRAEAGTQQPQAQAAPKEDAPPKQTDFDNYDDYVVAKAKYVIKQDLKAEEAARAQHQTTQQAQEAAVKFQERLTKAAEKYPDFQEVVFRQPSEGGPVVTTPMLQAMQESDVAADIAYYLGANVQESYRIAKLSPYAAAAEIGRLAAKFQTQTQPQTKKITSTPPPLTTVTGSGTVASKDIFDENMSAEDRVRWLRSG